MRKKECGVVLLTVAALAFAGGVTIVTGHKEFSENENRYLNQFPSITLSGILEGQVQEELTDAFVDQIPGRDCWTATATRVQKSLGFQDIGGVYLGEDNYYFEKIGNEDISQTNYFQNLRFINAVAAACSKAKVTAMLVPSPGIILKDKLPAHATLYQADKMYQEAQDMLKEVDFLDIRQELTQAAEENQEIYFHTDHHWNSYGAYLGYEAYAGQVGMNPTEYKEFDMEAVSGEFYGTLYSKVLDSEAQPDTINAPTNLPDVTCICDGKEQEGIYVTSQLDTKDKYAYYFGGNYGEVIITNSSAKSKKKLLVVKDSFANSMIPYLLKDYGEIRMLDMRYFKESAQNYIKKYEPEEILVLFEMSNFAQDEHLNRLTK